MLAAVICAIATNATAMRIDSIELAELKSSPTGMAPVEMAPSVHTLKSSVTTAVPCRPKREGAPQQGGDGKRQRARSTYP